MFVSKFDDLTSILIFSGNKLHLWRCPKQCTVKERKPIDVLKDQSVLFASRDVGRPKKLGGEGGGRKTMVSIICPHGLNRVKWFVPPPGPYIPDSTKYVVVTGNWWIWTLFPHDKLHYFNMVHLSFFFQTWKLFYLLP